jgi:hypothetical protein
MCNVISSGPGRKGGRRSEQSARRSRLGSAGLGRVSGWICAAALGIAGLGAGGCVVVKPYQREHLAERCMAAGFGDAAELKFRGHWEGSRQGSEGGYGTAGGGCGCN